MPGLDMGRRYDHAPIVEAIVEFRTVPSQDLLVDRLSALEFGDAYSKPEAIYQFQSEVQMQGEEVVNQDTRTAHVGFLYQRVDESRRIQVGGHAFTFVWRGNYTTWEEFIAEAEGAWLSYRAVARPEQLLSIGVRFVNHIPMPARPVEIKDYLRTSVDIPAYLPQEILALFFQVEIPLRDLDAHATITSSALGDPPPGGALLLDIDVKSELNLATEDDVFDERVRTTLNRLRLAKNFVFEACITDATRGVIS